MRRQELNGERRKRIVALVVDAVIFRIPLSDNDVVLQWRAGKTMEMQTINFDDVSGVLERRFHIPVLKHTIPDPVGSSFLMQKSLVFERFFCIYDRLNSGVFNLQQFGSIGGHRW